MGGQYWAPAAGLVRTRNYLAIRLLHQKKKQKKKLISGAELAQLLAETPTVMDAAHVHRFMQIDLKLRVQRGLGRRTAQ